MNKLIFKSLKVGDRLRKHDQFSFLLDSENWGEIEGCFKFLEKITKNMSGYYNFRRPDKDTLKLIKEIKKELSENEKIIDKINDIIYS